MHDCHGLMWLFTFSSVFSFFLPFSAVFVPFLVGVVLLILLLFVSNSFANVVNENGTRTHTIVQSYDCTHTHTSTHRTYNDMYGRNLNVVSFDDFNDECHVNTWDRVMYKDFYDWQFLGELCMRIIENKFHHISPSELKHFHTCTHAHTWINF